MAASFAQASAEFAQAIDLLNDTELALWSTTPNVAANCDDIEALNLYENQEAIASAVQAFRNGAGALLTEERVMATLLPFIQEMCVTIGAPEGRNVDFDTGCDRIRDYYIANSKTDNSRSQTFGAVSAVTGTGTGTVRYLTVDDEDFRLEGSHNETKTFTCLLDQSNVEKHHEVFEVKGAVPYRDGLKRTGSGMVASLTCLTTRNTARFLSNPSFSQYGGTTQPTASTEQTITSVTAITGWTADATTNIKVSVDTVYRGSSCDGTLTLTFGATTRAVDMTTLSNGAWNVVTLTLDKGLYARNFHSNNMQVKFALASRTTGHLYLDDVIMDEMTPLDGLYYVAVGGVTPFVRNDYQTIAVSEATRGTRSYWRELRSGRGRRGFFSLPTHTGGSETEVDP